VLVRFVIGEKKVVDVEVRHRYRWLMRWTFQPREIETTTGVAMVASSAAG
jgi:hypothetical protein